MSKLSDWNKEKLAARMKAKATRPEKPRFGEEVNLNAHLANMEKGMPDINQPVNESYDIMQERWAKGKSGGGDTFVDGLIAGTKRGSLIEDKKRMKKYSEGMEKLKAMVEDTNQRLYQEEKTDAARRSLEPRVYAYLEQAKQMAPDKRRAYIQGSMDEYNELAGTDYRIAAVDDMEPWKVTVMNGGQAEVMNLMEFVKNNPEKELDLYLKSNEADNIERAAMQEDAMVARDKSATRNVQNMKAEKLQREAQEDIDYREFESAIKKQTGDDVRVISSLPASLQLYAEKQIKEYTEKANQDLMAEKRLERAVKIAEDHPALFGNLKSIITSRYMEDPTLLNNTLKNLGVPKKDLDAAAELSGIVKNIFTDSVKGVTAKGINQFIEKKMEAGSPNTRWTAAAFKKVVQESKDEYSEQYNEHKKGSDYGSRGLIYRARAKERKAPATSFQAGDTVRIPQGSPITEEEIKKIEAKGIKVIR